MLQLAIACLVIAPHRGRPGFWRNRRLLRGRGEDPLRRFPRARRTVLLRRRGAQRTIVDLTRNQSPTSQCREHGCRTKTAGQLSSGMITRFSMTLAELQAQLFVADVQECGQRILVPSLVLLCGVASGLGLLSNRAGRLGSVARSGLRNILRRGVSDGGRGGSGFQRDAMRHRLVSGPPSTWLCCDARGRNSSATCVGSRKCSSVAGPREEIVSTTLGGP